LNRKENNNDTPNTVTHVYVLEDLDRSNKTISIKDFERYK